MQSITNTKKPLSFFEGRAAVIATMHRKEEVMEPVLREGLSLSMIVPEGFDTDRFGTFTREIQRTGSQREALRAKAHAAMEHTGLDIGIASEGSFGPHPSVPFLQSNLEMTMLVDRKHALEIVGYFRTSNVRAHSQTVYSLKEARDIALKWGFPEQGVIVRLSEHNPRHIYKELQNETDFSHAVDKLLSRPFTRSVFLETDMRAHRNPGRMASIREATKDLVQNCKRVCPQCATPGFVVTNVLQGLPCGVCGKPTDRPKAFEYSCQTCRYSKVEHVPHTDVADPGECQYCNP